MVLRDLVSDDDVKITLLALCESVGARLREQGTLLPGVRDKDLWNKEHDLETVLDRVRSKYGYQSIRRGLALLYPKLDLDAKSEHIIHPVGFLGTRT